MRATPCVSVVIPAHNARDVLGRALDSAVSQDHVGEVIVIDDGSTDDTAEEVRDRPNVELIRRERSRGAAAARNTGLERAGCPLVAFLDADDEWLPGKLRRQVEVLESCPEVGLVCTDFVKQGPNGPLGTGFRQHSSVYEVSAVLSGDVRIVSDGLFPALCDSLFVATPTVVVRQSVLKQAGHFDPAFRIAEDYDLWLRLSRLTTFAMIDRPLVNVYYEDDSLGSDTQVMLRETERMLSEFSGRNGRLTREEGAALKKKLAKIQMTLAYRARMRKDVLSAVRYYGRSFWNRPGAGKLTGMLFSVLGR